MMKVSVMNRIQVGAWLAYEDCTVTQARALIEQGRD